jgi:hypothetical protein
MAERVPNVDVEAILIDMARTWERLAVQTAQLSHANEGISFQPPAYMAFSFTAVM